MRTMDETAAAILAPPKGLLVVDEYAEALVGADRAHRFTESILRTDGLSDYVSAVLLTPEAFAALRPNGSPAADRRTDDDAGDSVGSPGRARCVVHRVAREPFTA